MLVVTNWRQCEIQTDCKKLILTNTMNTMQPIENIKISYQCPTSWDGMTLDNSGKFCNNCNKTVYDFTDKSFDDFQKLYQKHNGNLCGKFKVTQTTITLRHSKFRRFFSALLFILGYNLFTSNLKAQTVTQPSDSIKYTELKDTTAENIILGMVVEHLPVYKYGGEQGLMEFLSKNIKYPVDCPDGKVFVSFIVDTNGKVKEAKVMRGLREDADNEVIRVVNMLEFIPGEQAGKKIETRFTLPFSFKRNDDKKKE